MNNILKTAFFSIALSGLVYAGGHTTNVEPPSNLEGGTTDCVEGHDIGYGECSKYSGGNVGAAEPVGVTNPMRPIAMDDLEE